MDRAVSQEERIRRAEEIYRRRNQNKDYNFKIQNDYVSKKTAYKKAKKRMAKKLIIQSLVCLIIYFGIYATNDTNSNKFNEAFKNIKENAQKNINMELIKEKIENTKVWVRNKLNSITMENVEDTSTNDESENTQINIEENVADESTLPINDEAASVNIAEQEETKTQEEIDIEEAKSKNIIWPLNGIITSGFGPREATEIVSGNHHGLDIGGNIGASIVSAMNGIVTLVSSEGDYGKHIKIENGDITTLYAHCSKLLVKEGQEVSQGIEIAKVGQTGRATRSSFTF